jgi:hypothetical protein
LLKREKPLERLPEDDAGFGRAAAQFALPGKKAPAAAGAFS